LLIMAAQAPPKLALLIIDVASIFHSAEGGGAGDSL
jgi:hypothetical protein